MRTAIMERRRQQLAAKRERQQARDVMCSLNAWRQDIQDMAPFALPTDTVLRSDADFDAFERELFGDGE
ncbi:hypothetical protein [Bifidobacterium callitrichos]|uniref:hypothetical protein n=1 Tax=Bifidobacterium callitrichos TaxID=762209 RepID=UPI0011B27D60|nr:hypothetical protein [Bifidobacterium callitrichos]